MTLQELQENRNQLADQIRESGEAFKSAGNKWPDKAAETKWDKLNTEYDGIMSEMNEARSSTGVMDRLNQVNDLQNAPQDNRGIGLENASNGIQGTRAVGGDGATLANTSHVFRDLSSGQNVRALLSNERFAPAQANAAVSASVGNLIHSLVTGDSSAMAAGQFNSLIGGTDSGGGYILTPSLSGHVVDLARSASVAMRAGAVTLPMSAREMHIARLTQDPTGHWRPEGAGVQASTLGFDRVTLRAKTLAAIVPVTIELLEDAANVGTIINQALQAALGQALDNAVMFGTGSEEEPRGIRNAGGVNEIASVGTPADYTKVTAAVGDILSANYAGDVSGLSWITNPRDGETFDGLTDTTGQPLNPTPWARDLKRFSTTSLPIDEGGGSESSSIIGDFSQVVVGMRGTGVTIRVLDQGQVSDGTETHNATSELKKLVVAYLRADVALLRPSWMTVLSGITAS